MRLLSVPCETCPSPATGKQVEVAGRSKRHNCTIHQGIRLTRWQPLERSVRAEIACPDDKAGYPSRKGKLELLISPSPVCRASQISKKLLSARKSIPNQDSSTSLVSGLSAYRRVPPSEMQPEPSNLPVNRRKNPRK